MRQGAPALTVVAVCAALLAGVAGCSGAGSPGPDPTIHPGTAPTASGSAGPTPDPGQAAIAAVQRMFRAYNQMLRSGSSQAYRATFTKDCAECLNSVERAESVNSRGQQIRGGTVAVGRLRVVGVYPGLKLVSLQGSVRQAAADLVKQGNVVEHYDAYSTSVVWNVTNTDAGWLVSRSTDVG